jgi:Holliday junction resolvase RusA-like endonuclease
LKIYNIPGDPCPLARARFSSRHVYDSQSELKTYLRISLENQHGEDELFTGPLHMFATFFMGIPKSAKDIEGKPHYYRPDLDNLVKLVCDISNGIIFKDDSCISKMTIEKVYSYEPHTEFCFHRMINHGKCGIKGE